MSQIIQDSGAVEAIEEHIDTLTESGLEHLHAAGVDEKVSAALRDLAIRATSRQK